MRLAAVKLQGFRCYENETQINIDSDLTAFIGKNDVGKSTIFDALQIFFDEKGIDQEDLNKAALKNGNFTVSITCLFEGLPEQIVIDSDYPTDLKSEFLLNGQGQLEIVKKFNCKLVTPKLSGVFANALHPALDGLNDLLLLKNADLKKRAQDQGIDLSKIEGGKINTLVRRSIWAAAQAETQLELQEIDLDNEDAKRIWSMLKRYVPVFAVFRSDRPSTDQDSEAQDPMKLAVKEALKSKEDELQKIVEDITREVTKVAEVTVQKIAEMEPELAAGLEPRVSTKPWHNIFNIRLEDDENISLNKRGSGVRRLILLNFFRAKVEKLLNEGDAASAIYAIEEPETSQHPNYQQMLAEALLDISQNPHSQILISTHTPQFVRLLETRNIRFIEKMPDGKRKIADDTDDSLLNNVISSLGIIKDHDVKVIVCVEGNTDIHFLKNISTILVQDGIEVPNLAQLQRKGKLSFRIMGGSSLIHAVHQALNINVPEFHIYDRDTKPPKKPIYQDTMDLVNEGVNTAVCTEKLEIENYLHETAIEAVYGTLGLNISDWDWQDIPDAVAQAAHNQALKKRETIVRWRDLSDEKRSKKTSRAKKRLCFNAAAVMNSVLLDERDPNGDVIGWLKAIGELVDSS